MDKILKPENFEANPNGVPQEENGITGTELLEILSLPLDHITPDAQSSSDLSNAEFADSQKDETSDQTVATPSNSVKNNGNGAVPDVQPSISGINLLHQIKSLHIQPQTQSIKERPLRQVAVKCHEFLHRNLSYL
ncbi:UNVERIFIED_CONTAM: hypothetical protein RMT77_011073 [Armadillidium vulgare]